MRQNYCVYVLKLNIQFVHVGVSFSSFTHLSKDSTILTSTNLCYVYARFYIMSTLESVSITSFHWFGCYNRCSRVLLLSK